VKVEREKIGKEDRSKGMVRSFSHPPDNRLRAKDMFEGGGRNEEERRRKEGL